MNKSIKQHFWQWFSRHNQEYLALKNKSKRQSAYWVNELSAHLRACSRFLGFSLEWRDAHCVLTITTGGRSKYFKHADALVAMAPAIPGWSIVALEPPRPVDFLLDQQIQATGIDPREMYFSFGGYDHSILFVYHLLCSPDNEDAISRMATAAVFNLLGERSFGTDIRLIRVMNLSEAEGEEVAELESLATVMGLAHSGMVVDGKGRLVG